MTGSFAQILPSVTPLLEEEPARLQQSEVPQDLSLSHRQSGEGLGGMTAPLIQMSVNNEQQGQNDVKQPAGQADAPLLQPLALYPLNFAIDFTRRNINVAMPSLGHPHPSCPRPAVFNPSSVHLVGSVPYVVSYNQNILYQLPVYAPFPVPSYENGFRPYNPNFSLLAKEAIYQARLWTEMANSSNLWEEAVLFKAIFSEIDGRPRFPFNYSSFASFSTAIEACRSGERRLQSLSDQPVMRQYIPAPLVTHRLIRARRSRRCRRCFNHGIVVKEWEHTTERRCPYTYCVCNRCEPPRRNRPNREVELPVEEDQSRAQSEVQSNTSASDLDPPALP